MHDAPRRHAALTRAALLVLCCCAPSTALAQQPATAEATDPSRTRLTLRILPTDATVTLDGEALTPDTDTLYLSPGTHTLLVSAPGHIPREETLNLEAFASREILMSINLSRQPEAPVTSIRHDGIIDHMGTGRPLTGWLMTAAGAALITTSVVLAIRQANVLSECRDRGRCEPQTAATGWTTLSATLGGASLLGGITLLSWSALAGEPQRGAASSLKGARRVGLAISLDF